MPVAKSTPARPKLYLARVFFVALALASFAGATRAQAVPTQARQEAQKYAELPNFRQVGERLYRGGQPLPGGVGKLAALGGARNMQGRRFVEEGFRRAGLRGSLKRIVVRLRLKL